MSEIGVIDLLDALLLILGMGLLIKGADFFVDGASSIAKYFKIPPLVIGLTVVAFGTSAPEASVSITAAVRGFNDMAFANVIGSNMMNSLLILGLALVFMPIKVDDSLIKREIPFSLLASVLLIVFYFVGYQVIGRTQGAILFGLLIFFLVYIVRSALNNPEDVHIEDVQMSMTKPKASLFLALGLAGIILGGNFITGSASSIALKLGMSEMLVGLTIVAFGTSLPELVTSVVAAIKKENAIALGNIVGSNIFNIFFVLGASSIIRPITMIGDAIVDLVILTLVTIVVLVFAFTNKTFSRFEGILLLIIYAVYLTYVIARN